MDEIIKKKISEGKTRLTFAENSYIHSNYRRAKSIKDGNWVCVCLEGSDWKYGRYYIDPDRKLMRDCTFNEFYGGGIVD